MKILGLDMAGLENMEKIHGVEIDINLIMHGDGSLVIRTRRGDKTEVFIFSNENFDFIRGDGRINRYVSGIIMAQINNINASKESS